MYARRDILPLLPGILAKDFIIMIDDCGRSGEKRTIADIEVVLAKSGIAYEKKLYTGEETKLACVIASKTCRFVCSM